VDKAYTTVSRGGAPASITYKSSMPDEAAQSHDRDVLAAALSAALASVRDDFARCVARAHAAGIAVLHFTANDDGSVSDVDVKLKNEAARTCIAKALAKLHVDHAGRVSYAIPFHAQPVVETKHESATLLDALGCGNAFR